MYLDKTVDKLAASFTTSSVMEAVQDFEQALDLFKTKDTFANRKCAEVVCHLDQVQAQASKHPQSEDVAIGFTAFSDLIADLKNRYSLSTAELCIHRQAIMLANWSLFKWLDILLDNIWTNVSSECPSWIQRLGQKVQLAVSGAFATGEAVFECSDYLPSLKCLPYRYLRHTDSQINQRSRRVEDTECLRHTVCIVHKLCMQSFSFGWDTLPTLPLKLAITFVML